MSRSLDPLSGVALSARRTRQFEFMLTTVKDIVRSKEVSEFCIGITAKAFARRNAYTRWCSKYEGELRGFVLLDWGRNATQILECERWLFHRLEPHRKYSKNENRRYYPSAARHLDGQVIYLAWWTW